MKNYSRVDVSEAQLEGLVRLRTELIEDGLEYVDHQKVAAGGRLDVLLVDSDKTLVIAELKIVQDDEMLWQAIDYFDYVSTHVEALARLYKDHAIDPTKQVRLMLIAPSFSQAMINRCKWVDVPCSLFTFQCLKFEDEDDIVPVFSEQSVPTPPPVLTITSLDDHYNYITELGVRAEAQSLLAEIKNWKAGNITLDPISGAISIKVNNRVFAYFHPRRRHYVMSTYSVDNIWTDYAIKSSDDLEMVKQLLKAAMELYSKPTK